MDSNDHDKSIRTPTLQAAIVEPILVCCINEISFNDLEYEIQKISPLPSNKLKKYLLYLIDYQIISYNGHRQVYTTEIGGYDLFRCYKLWLMFILH